MDHCIPIVLPLTLTKTSKEIALFSLVIYRREREPLMVAAIALNKGFDLFLYF